MCTVIILSVMLSEYLILVLREYDGLGEVMDLGVRALRWDSCNTVTRINC